jgi:hypothetical protein
MSRPIAADGTISVSTGSPGREYAAADPEPPATAINPGSTRAASAPAKILRAILLTSVILFAHLSGNAASAAVFDSDSRTGAPDAAGSGAAASHLP